MSFIRSTADVTDVFRHATSHTVSLTDCNNTRVTQCHTAPSYLFMGPRRRRRAATATWSRGWPAPVDRLAPFRHFSITATTAAALLHNHRRRSPTRRTNEKSLRATAPALPKKWTTKRATRGGEKLNLSDQVRRRVERQLRDSVCAVAAAASADRRRGTRTTVRLCT